MTAAEMLDGLRDDPQLAAVLDAVEPYLRPLSRLAWAEVQDILTNLRNKNYHPAYQALANECRGVDELGPILRESRDKAAPAAVAQVERIEDAQELILKLVMAAAVAALL